MNPWYLPSIPTTLLGYSDMCEAYKDLFIQMNKKGASS